MKTRLTIDAAILHKGRDITLDLNASYKVYVQKNGPNGLYLDMAQYETLVALLSNSNDYHVSELVVAHPAAITSQKELMQALDRNPTVITIMQENHLNWSPDATKSHEENHQKLIQILSRNHFFAQEKNRAHLEAFKKLMTASSAQEFQAALSHQYPEDFSQKFQDILPHHLQAVASSKDTQSICELFYCFMTPLYESGLAFLTKIYEDNSNDKPLLYDNKHHLLSIALSTKNKTAIESALRLYEIQKTKSPEIHIDLSEHDYLIDDMISIEDYLNGNSALIAKTILLVLDSQPSLLSLNTSNESLQDCVEQLFAMLAPLIKHSNNPHLDTVIKITERIADEIISSELITADKKHCFLTRNTNSLAMVIARNTPTFEITKGHTQPQNPWKNVLVKLCWLDNIVIMNSQQFNDHFISLLGDGFENSTLSVSSFLLITLFESMPSQTACCFLADTEEKRNFVQLFYRKLPNLPEDDLDQMINLFEKTVFIAAQNNKDGLVEFLNHDAVILKYSQVSGNPKVLDLTLRFYNQALTINKTFRLPNSNKFWGLIFNILEASSFSLEQKRSLVNLALIRKNDKEPAAILFNQKISGHTISKKPQMLFTLLARLHKDNVDDFIDLLQALQGFNITVNTLWNRCDFMYEACSQSLNDGKPLTAEAAIIYMKLTGEMSARPTLVNAEHLLPLIIFFENRSSVSSDMKMSLLSLLLIDETLTQTQAILFTSQSLFNAIVHIDHDGHSAEFICDHILSYQNEEGFDQLWQTYTYVSAKCLTEEGANPTNRHMEFDRNGMIILPKALKLLPAMDWVEVFFNLRSSDKARYSGEILPTAHYRTYSHHVNINYIIAIPYLHLALGNYFKTYAYRLTYTKRANAFVAYVDAVLNDRKISLRADFSDSTFSRLYKNLPQTKYSHSCNSTNFSLLYEFCVNENNQEGADQNSNFHQLIIQPLLKMLDPLFNSQAVAAPKHGIDKSNQEAAKKEDSSLRRDGEATKAPSDLIYIENGNKNVHFQMNAMSSAPALPSPTGDGS